MVEMAIGKNVLSNLVGYRFHPTDQEIISYFLKNKMRGLNHLVQAIPKVDICKHDPWELPKFSGLESDDQEWFFFSTLDIKHNIRIRLNRKTRSGFWKPTGNARTIKDKKTKKEIGTKRTLVFYKKGRGAEATRTNWVINEYHSVEKQPRKRTYVVCLLENKDDDEVDPQIGQIETALPEEANCDHLNWEMDMDEVNKFLNSIIVNPCENELQPPNSSEMGECSRWSCTPQFLMLQNVEGNTLLIRYVEHDKIHRCIEFSVHANSGQAMSRILLQREIGNPGGNPFKTDKSSKYTWYSENGMWRRSPSEYLVNFIAGIVLLIVFVREMVLYWKYGM